jgi:hypothetical protein
MKLYANIAKDTQINNNKIDNLDEIVDFIVLENDKNRRPIINIDLLSKKI